MADQDEILARLQRIDHTLGNVANVFNLYVAQEDRLHRKPLWLAKQLVLMLEDREVKIEKDDLLETLNVLDRVEALIEKRLESA